MGISTDLRYGFRKLGGSKLFTVSAALILGLGLGANWTTFAFLNQLLWSGPAQVKDASRVVLVELEHSPIVGGGGDYFADRTSYPLFDYLRTAVSESPPLFAEAREDVGIGRGASSEQVQAALISPGYFPLLGVSTIVGRSFTDEDAQSQVVVLGYRLWQRRFNGSSSVIGSTCRIANQLYTIIGVAPEGFTGIRPKPVDLWLPIEAAAAAVYPAPTELGPLYEVRSNWVSIVGRLAPDESSEALGHEVAGLLSGSEGTMLSYRPVLGARAVPITELDRVNSGLGRLSTWAAVVSILALLIACANVSNLLLLRNFSRRAEIAIRLQLGASGGQLVRQLLIECLLICLAAGLLAVGFMAAMSSLLSEWLLGRHFGLFDLLDGRTLVVFGSVTLLSTLVTGLLPALRSLRLNIASALKPDVTHSLLSANRLRAAMVVGQLALACALAVSAGLFWQSFEKATSVDLGFDAERSLIAEFPGLEQIGYRPAQVEALCRKVVEAARRLPGVDGAGLSSSAPWSTLGFFGGVTADGRKPVTEEAPGLSAVSSGYFSAMKTAFVLGRAFKESDVAGGVRVAIVNQGLANRYWPDEDPLGRCLHIMGNPACVQVVGVVRDTPLYRFDKPQPQCFIPLSQSSAYDATSGLSPRVVVLHLREAALGLGIADSLSRLPGLPYIRIRSMYDDIEPQFRNWKRGIVLFGILSLIALGVALAGFYAQLAYWLAGRRHEVGIRVAVGAAPADIVTLILRQSFLLAGFGLAAGLAVAVGLGQFMRSLYYSVSVEDPWTFTLVAGGFLLLTLAMSILPCRRALKVNPTDYLRCE